jgi:hypothetical protein
LSTGPSPDRPHLYALRGGGEKGAGFPSTPSSDHGPRDTRLYVVRKELLPVLQRDGADQYRELLFEEIRCRFGPPAAEHLVTRLGFATRQQVIAWHRRATYMVSYPELLDPQPLAVWRIAPAQLLRHAFGEPLQDSILVRFSRSRDRDGDRNLLYHLAPWFLDLPDLELALSLLRVHGWLLYECAQSGQAPRLAEATERHKRLSVVHIVPGRIAGMTENEIDRLYLRPLLLDGFEKCLR